MNARPPRFARARLAGVLALAVVAGACEKALPTSAEIERMNVATLEARAAAVRPGGAPPVVTYLVDDRPATREQVHALPEGRIERMVVGGGTIRLYTSPRAEGQGRGAHVDGSIRFGTDEPPPVYPVSDGSPTLRMDAAERFAGLLVVDGVITDRAGLARLRPEDVAQIEIIKGAAAVRIYDDPRAANGVIRLTTTAAANR